MFNICFCFKNTFSKRGSHPKHMFPPCVGRRANTNVGPSKLQRRAWKPKLKLSHLAAEASCDKAAALWYWHWERGGLGLSCLLGVWTPLSLHPLAPSGTRLFAFGEWQCKNYQDVNLGCIALLIKIKNSLFSFHGFTLWHNGILTSVHTVPSFTSKLLHYLQKYK